MSASTTSMILETESSQEASSVKEYTVTEVCQFINELPIEESSRTEMRKISGEKYRIHYRSPNHFAKVTLGDLCRISKRNSMLASSLLSSFDYILSYGIKNEAVFEKSINDFIGNITLNDMSVIASKKFIDRAVRVFTVDPEEKVARLTPLKFRTPCIANRFKQKPIFIKEYCIELLKKQYFQIPAVLLKKIDLTEAFQLSSYDTLHKSGVEGYWADRDEAIFQVAEQSKPSFAELRALILKKRKEKGDDWRYPVPCEKSWAGSDAIIDCLEALELLGNRKDWIEDNIELIVSILEPSSFADRQLIESLLRNALSSNVIQVVQGGNADLRLPLLGILKGQGGDFETYVQLKDGRKMIWTAAYTRYLKDFRCVPARKFLEMFDAFQKDFGEHYTVIAQKIKEFCLKSSPSLMLTMSAASTTTENADNAASAATAVSSNTAADSNTAANALLLSYESKKKLDQSLAPAVVAAPTSTNSGTAKPPSTSETAVNVSVTTASSTSSGTSSGTTNTANATSSSSIKTAATVKNADFAANLKKAFMNKKGLFG